MGDIDYRYNTPYKQAREELLRNLKEIKRNNGLELILWLSSCVDVLDKQARSSIYKFERISFPFDRIMDELETTTSIEVLEVIEPSLHKYVNEYNSNFTDVFTGIEFEIVFEDFLAYVNHEFYERKVNLIGIRNEMSSVLNESREIENTPYKVHFSLPAIRSKKVAPYYYFSNKKKNKSARSEMVFCDSESVDVVKWYKEYFEVLTRSGYQRFLYTEMSFYEKKAKKISDNKIFSTKGKLSEEGTAECENTFGVSEFLFNEDSVPMSFVQFPTGEVYHCVSFLIDKMIVHCETGNREIYYKEIV